MNSAEIRRVTILFFIISFLYLIILFTLYLIQIHQHDFYTKLGTKQYHITVTQRPPRAAIYDRNGNHLALNRECLSAFILPKQLEEPERLKLFLAEHFPAAHKRLARDTDTHFIFVKRHLSPAEEILIEQANLQDIHLLREPSRFYPSEASGSVVGITNIDTVGLFGIELTFNDQLAGTPTTYALEKDARSGKFYFQKKTTISGSNGTPVTLTLDSTLQFLVAEAVKETIEKFNAKEGAALVINPENGDILAMATLPTFDPNSRENLALETTKNTLITETYELGSVIKVFSALAALEEGLVTPDEPIDCEDKQTTLIAGRKVNTTPTTEAGVIPFSRVIQKSNNIGTAKVALRLGEKIYEHYRRLGFGNKTGIPLPGEREGFVNPPKNWSKQSIISLSYGYEIAGTLLQIARAFSIIANDGRAVTPHLILSDESKQSPEQLYSKKSCQDIKAILDSTNRTGRIPRVPSCSVMSKTGTANLLENGSYNPNKNIFTCAGIIEHKPSGYKRVVAVYVKEIEQKKLLASRVAAPLLETIARNLVIHDHVI